MKLKDKIIIEYTGTRTFVAEKARLEAQQRIYGNQSAVFANNGTTESKRKTKNKVASIAIEDKEIVPDTVMVYKAKLDNADETTLGKDLKAIEFAFWIQDKNKKEVKLHENVTYIRRTKKKGRFAINIKRKGDLASSDYSTDFTDTDSIESFTEGIGKYAYHYAKITTTDTEAVLEIKFSKWMDNYKIRMEAYYKTEQPLGDGAKTTASRIVKAAPEIIEAYWLNPEGKKITQTGYTQNIFIYLKTLGLIGETLKTNIYDKDYFFNPRYPKTFPNFYRSGDDLIDWKNNQIKIDSREVLKQFKVGDKNRYEEAQKDEQDIEYMNWYKKAIAKGDFFTVMDFSEKYGNDLDLYIHFPDWETLNLPIKNQYANLVLTSKERISDAFFAVIETQKVQADAPVTKTQPNPTTKAAYYKPISKGVLGETVKLVAVCPNLEGKRVTFDVYECDPLLAKEGKKLPLLFNNKENQNIEAIVKDGYAVAEVKLQHSKEDTGYEDWEKKLDPDNGELKTAELYIKASIVENVFTVTHNNEFLKEKPFEMRVAVDQYEIHQNHKIFKTTFEKSKKGSYYYSDLSNNKHLIFTVKYNKIKYAYPFVSLLVFSYF